MVANQRLSRLRDHLEGAGGGLAASGGQVSDVAHGAIDAVWWCIDGGRVYIQGGVCRSHPTHPSNDRMPLLR